MRNACPIKNVRTGGEREREKTGEVAGGEEARKQNEREIQREKARQFDTFLLCNARVIITDARDARLIMTF